jgi:hypothetical protein
MSATTPSTSNRRNSHRQTARGSTRVRAYRNAMGLGPNIAVSVLDLSESGVRLLLKEDLPAGREIEVRIESTTASGPKVVVARVIWSVATADGAFCVGARFDKPLAHRDLLALVRP